MRDLRFLAGVHAVEAPERVAVFYLMNTSVNRNNWAVTEEALEEALPTILGKPLMCGPAYQTDTHYPEGLEVGRFTGYRKPDGYALAQAVVTDEEAWRRLTRGEWGPISVVITSHRERCSLCGEDLSHNPEPFTHPCLSRGGHLEWTSDRPQPTPRQASWGEGWRPSPWSSWRGWPAHPRASQAATLEAIPAKWFLWRKKSLEPPWRAWRRGFDASSPASRASPRPRRWRPPRPWKRPWRRPG